MNLKIRLIVMNFLQYAVWGTYLTCMARYLGPHGMGDHIGLFYSVQGIVSIFMPALVGILADRWIPAQKMLGICHALAGISMIAASFYGITAGDGVQFGVFFSLYTFSVAFYMPTIALSNSVAYNALERGGLDTVKDFPPIRVFGTIGFIAAMWAVDLLGFQETPYQFMMSGGMGILLALYAFTLPNCPIIKSETKKTMAQALGLEAFSLFKQKRMAIFFIFSMLLGASLQITNGFANPFINSFASVKEYKDTFGVQHSNMLISLSQISETMCILLIPFFLKKFGIKKVMLMAMFAWVLRFGFFGIGNPGGGVWLFILSMIVYGLAFDFFNISGSLFVNQETDPSIRSSAQGLFMLMTNGLGATIGTLGAQWVVNQFCEWNQSGLLVGDWASVWYIFAGYSLVVAIVFAIVFKYKHQPKKLKLDK
ncbi:MAG TPA: nucleoside permease [Bacteroidales bacterium]|nr:nucleoside permease [Bacteroidales bacterium]HPT53037.1 nucleoside permease [Bacteroidales bacterium]